MRSPASRHPFPQRCRCSQLQVLPVLTGVSRLRAGCEQRAYRGGLGVGVAGNRNTLAGELQRRFLSRTHACIIEGPFVARSLLCPFALLLCSQLVCCCCGLLHRECFLPPPVAVSGRQRRAVVRAFPGGAKGRVSSGERDVCASGRELNQAQRGGTGRKRTARVWGSGGWGRRGACLHRGLR